MESFPRISPFGDQALLLEFSADINPQTLGAMQGFLRRLTAAQIQGLKELIPSYSSLLVGFDPSLWPFSALSAKVKEILAGKDPFPDTPRRSRGSRWFMEGHSARIFPMWRIFTKSPRPKSWRGNTSTVYRCMPSEDSPVYPPWELSPRKSKPLASPPSNQSGRLGPSPCGETDRDLCGRIPRRVAADRADAPPIFRPIPESPSWFQTGDRVQFLPDPGGGI